MGESGHAVTFTSRETAELLSAPSDTAPLGAEEVAGRTLCTLISAGTELAGAYLGQTFPRVPGYAAAFEVTEVGSVWNRASSITLPLGNWRGGQAKGHPRSGRPAYETPRPATVVSRVPPPPLQIDCSCGRGSGLERVHRSVMHGILALVLDLVLGAAA